VQGKEGKDHLDRLREKWRSVIKEERNIVQKIKRKLTGLDTPCVEPASKTHY